MTQLTKAIGGFEIGGRDGSASDAMICIGDLRRNKGMANQANTAYCVAYNRKALQVL